MNSSLKGVGRDEKKGDAESFLTNASHVANIGLATVVGAEVIAKLKAKMKGKKFKLSAKEELDRIEFAYDEDEETGPYAKIGALSGGLAGAGVGLALPNIASAQRKADVLAKKGGYRNLRRAENPAWNKGVTPMSTRAGLAGKAEVAYANTKTVAGNLAKKAPLFNQRVNRSIARARMGGRGLLGLGLGLAGAGAGYMAGKLLDYSAQLDDIIEFARGDQVQRLLKAVGTRASSGASKGPALDMLSKLGTSYAQIQHPAAFRGATQGSFGDGLLRVARGKDKYMDHPHHRRMLAHMVKDWRAGNQLSAKDQLAAIELKAVDLGYSYDQSGSCYPSACEPKKKYYPTLYINDRADEIDLPLEGTAKVKFKLRSKTTRQGEDGVKRHSADIEVQSIDLIKEEEKKKSSLKPLNYSAQIKAIELAADPRPRNRLGMFEDQEEGAPDPNAIHATYKSGMSFPAKAAAVTGGGVAGGLGARALLSKILKRAPKA